MESRRSKKLREGLKKLFGEPCRVTFLGHREIFRGWEQFGPILRDIIHMILRKKLGAICFLGKNGDFDEMAANALFEARQELGEEAVGMVILVNPYQKIELSPNERRRYDDVISPIKTHPKQAIEKRNEWMIDHSDLVIAYVKKEGGAYKALKYAEKKKKNIINLAWLCD